MRRCWDMVAYCVGCWLCEGDFLLYYFLVLKGKLLGWMLRVIYILKDFKEVL
jgi:hypothetical protein